MGRVAQAQQALKGAWKPGGRCGAHAVVGFRSRVWMTAHTYIMTTTHSCKHTCGCHQHTHTHTHTHISWPQHTHANTPAVATSTHTHTLTHTYTHTLTHTHTHTHTQTHIMATTHSCKHTGGCHQHTWWVFRKPLLSAVSVGVAVEHMHLRAQLGWQLTTQHLCLLLGQRTCLREEDDEPAGAGRQAAGFRVRRTGSGV